MNIDIDNPARLQANPARVVQRPSIVVAKF